MQMQHIIHTCVVKQAEATTDRHSFRFRVCDKDYGGTASDRYATRANAALDVAPRHPFDLMRIPLYTPNKSMLNFDGARCRAFTSRTTMQH